MLNTHKRIFGFTIIESMVIIAAAVFQILYIKKLLDNKVIV